MAVDVFVGVVFASLRTEGGFLFCWSGRGCWEGSLELEGFLTHLGWFFGSGSGGGGEREDGGRRRLFHWPHGFLRFFRFCVESWDKREGTHVLRASLHLCIGYWMSRSGLIGIQK